MQLKHDEQQLNANIEINGCWKIKSACCFLMYVCLSVLSSFISLSLFLSFVFSWLLTIQKSNNFFSEKKKEFTVSSWLMSLGEKVYLLLFCYSNQLIIICGKRERKQISIYDSCNGWRNSSANAFNRRGNSSSLVDSHLYIYLSSRSLLSWIFVCQIIIRSYA